MLVVAQPAAADTVENQPVEDPPSSRFTWRIDNLSRLNTKKLYSEVFDVGGFKWYISHSHFVDSITVISCFLFLAIATHD